MLETPSGPAHAPPFRGAERESGGPLEPAGGLTGRALVSILRRRKLPLLACALLIPVLALVALKRVTPRYTAVGTLIYEPNRFKPPELQSILQEDPITEAVMSSQAEVLHGLRVIEPVAHQLDLFADPEFNPALHGPSWTGSALAALHKLLHPQPSPDSAVGPPVTSPANAVLLNVQQALDVHPVNASHVLEVSFTAENPVLAAAVVNNLMDTYIKSQLAAKLSAVDKARAWLETRAAELRAQVRTAENRIAGYRAREGLVRGVHAGLDTEQGSQLTEDLARARADLASAEGRQDAARNHAGAAALAGVAPSVVQLRQQTAALAAQLQSLNARLGPNHPDVVALRREIEQSERDTAAETARVVTATEAEVRAARDRVAALEADLTASQSRVDRNEQAQIPLNALERDADASRTLLAAVLTRIQETAQRAAVETVDAREVSLALPPEAPSYPRTGPMLAAALMFGVLFGLFVVYVQELADTSLRSGEEVRALGLPCLALIPEMRRRHIGRLRVEDYAALKPLSGFAEQVRGLRASLWRGGATRPGVVAVTAARPAEGKTTLALSLARVTAMAGERVLLLDCDLRRPSLARLLGAEGQPGLAECLIGTATLAQVIRKDPLTSMAYIPAGSAGADAAGLFMSDAMARALQTLRQEYDLVLMDAPPALAVSDTRLIARLADATLFCARWERTRREIARHAIELLDESQASIAGLVLTRVDARAHGRSGYADAEACPARNPRYFRD
jgi:capsular exopolysaccharide synthesis family protein